MSFEVARFGDLFSEPQRNGLTRPKKVRGNGLPMVNMGELFSHPRIKDVSMDLVPLDAKEHHYILEESDLLFARQSLVLSGAGQCSIFLGNTKPTVFESHLIRCRLDKEHSNPLFYFYFFRSPEGRRVVEAIVEQGAGASGIRGSDLINVTVPNPSKKIQDGIASLLNTLDDRITLIRETNSTLETIAQALFKSWFVDFDPVRTKSEGKLPKGIDEATAALFPDVFEEAELGTVPKGWRVSALSEIANLNAQSWSVRNAPCEITYLDLASVKSNIFDAFQSYPFADAPSRARRILRKNDCIVGTVRPANRSFGFITQADNNLTGSTGFAVLSPKQKDVATFVYLCATQEVNIDRLAALADGGAYPAVKPELVADTPCVLPTDEVMKAFDEIANPLLYSVGTNSLRVQNLSALRDALLPRLISGQLSIADAEAELEKVTA